MVSPFTSPYSGRLGTSTKDRLIQEVGYVCPARASYANMQRTEKCQPFNQYTKPVLSEPSRGAVTSTLPELSSVVVWHDFGTAHLQAFSTIQLEDDGARFCSLLLGFILLRRCVVSRAAGGIAAHGSAC